MLYKQVFIKMEKQILKDYIEVSYKNLSTSYIFFDDHFISKDNQTEQKLNYEDRVELNLFYKLINFIYKDKRWN